MGFFLSAALLGALVVAAAFFTLLFVIRLVLWVVLLPLRVGFAALLIPFWLAKTALRLVGFAIVAPIVALVTIVGLVGVVFAAIAAVFVPLAPIVIVGLLLWAIFRAASRPAVRVG